MSWTGQSLGRCARPSRRSSHRDPDRRAPSSHRYPEPSGEERETTQYLEDLLQDAGLTVNGIVFVITDGEDNQSTQSVSAIRDALTKARSAEHLESVLAILVGVGTENQDLPGFVAMSPRAQPRGKLANWGNSFLPGAYAGTYVNIASMKPEAILRDLKNKHLARADQKRQADLLARLNRVQLERVKQDRQLEASIEAMEMAFRMQFAVPEAFDLSKESKSTLEMYGGSEYAKGCLLARRLIERGVRTIQLSHSIDGYDIAWDTGHNDIAGGHTRLARACDQGIAALLTDLKQRGLWDETLVFWTGEFGRAPTSEGKKGRDHDHYGFTCWLAGGAVKPGFSYGSTDEFGLTAVENRVHVHDLHATLLHVMGLDHKRLTYRYSGRDFRLTDVHGNVVHDILA